MLDRTPSPASKTRSIFRSAATAFLGAAVALGVGRALGGWAGFAVGLGAAGLLGWVLAWLGRTVPQTGLPDATVTLEKVGPARESAASVPPAQGPGATAGTPAIGDADADRRAWEALYGAALAPMLRQATLALERAGEALDQAPGLRPLLGIGHGATIRAQETLARLRHHGPLAPTMPTLREPFPLREDLAFGARALGYEVGREVVLRFAPNFPAHALTDRAALRLALATVFHAAVEAAEARGESARELLVEAEQDETTPARSIVRVIVSADGGGALRAPLAPLDAQDATLALRGLGQLLGAATGDGGRVLASACGRRVGFQMPVLRYKRLTGTTLYGLGALSDRTALVIDSRPLGRASICELLAGWRLLPTAAASFEEARESTRVARLADRPFDVVIVVADEVESEGLYAAIGATIESFRAASGRANLVLLEGVEALALPLPPSLANAPGVEVRRTPRPPSPLELIEVLTALIVQRPAEVTPRARTEGGWSVLVAEDDPVNQALLVKMLERRHHSVVLAQNGADLVDRLTENPDGFDVVLMDIKMPVMDGYEATSVIRLREAQSRRPRLPIIAVTAHAMQGERERCLAAGMDAYLPKPVADAELLRTIEEVVATLRPRDAVAEDATSEIFDRKRVLEFAAGDAGFVASLVELFGATAPRQIEQIEAGIAAGDGNAVFRAAHQLKGSIGNFGAEAARALAAEVEELGRTGQLDLASAHLEPLRVAIDALLGALRELVVQMSATGSGAKG